MKSLQQYLKIKEDKPWDEQKASIKVGTKLKWGDRVQEVIKIGPDSDTNPIKFKGGSETSWEHVRASMSIVKEDKISEKKDVILFQPGDLVVVNGRKGKVRKCDEDQCIVDFDNGSGRFDVTKVEKCVNESTTSKIRVSKVDVNNLPKYFSDEFQALVDFHRDIGIPDEDKYSFAIDNKSKIVYVTDGKLLWSYSESNSEWKKSSINICNPWDSKSIFNKLNESLLVEFINMKRITVGHSKPKTMKNEGDIVIIRNEDEAIEKVISMMGLSRDGKPKKVGECFIVYDDSHKNIAFYEKEADIPKQD